MQRLGKVSWLIVGAVAAAVVATQVSAAIAPLSHGFWRSHADPSKNNYASTWDLVGELGPDSEFMGTGESWIEVISRPTNGNAYYILAHQYIAAQLNIMNGALNSLEVDSSSRAADIELIVEHGRSLLSTNLPGSVLLDSTQESVEVEVVRSAMRQDFVNTALILDEWNNSGADDD